MTSSNIDLCPISVYTVNGKLNNDLWNINKCYFKYMQNAFIDGILLTNEDPLNKSINEDPLNKSINKLLDAYYAETEQFKNFNDFGYNIIELCNNTIQNTTSLCAFKLTNLCKDMDIETVGQQRFCGCYQDTDNIECSFGCNAPYTIQNTKQCVEQRCIIDNISIQAINSNLKNVNISQACAGCTQETPCICYFNASSSDPGIVGAAYSNLESNCDATLCAIDGNDISCDLLPKNQNTGSRNFTLWIFLIVIGILIIICLLLSITSKT